MLEGSGVEGALRALGYHPDWLACGWVDERFLGEQLARFREGDDPNTEHYRYAAFQRVLRSRSALDDRQVAHYVALTRDDPDATMGEAAFIDLLWWRGLTPERFDRLEAQPAFPTRAVRSVIARVRQQQAQR